MAKQLIGIGSSANDGTGDNLRVGGDKVNDNFNEIYTAIGDGTTLTSGTFITTTSTNTLTNKSIDLTDNTVTGTLAELNTAVSDATLVSTTGSVTLTNKTINGPDNTITNIVNANLSGSAAISNANLANSSISIGGVSLNLGDTDATPAFNLSDATDYPTSSLSGTITNAQLDGSIVNSKLSNSTISIIADDSSAQSIALGGSILFTGGSGITTSISGNEISFVTDGSIVTETSTDTLTNKTINGPDNTLTNIANGSLANSTVTLGATSVALGATAGSASNFNLSGTSSISGSGTIDTTGSGNKLRFNVAAESAAALGSAIDPNTYEGMFAYNTTENRAYVADTGGWVRLFDENISVGDISNVDLSGITNGQILAWNSGDAKFVATSAGAGFSVGTDLDQAGADIQDIGYISHRSPDATVTQSLTVTVASKTSEHTAFGDGSSNGYLIDGHEGAHLNLSRGVYKFDQADSSNSGHPLRFYYDEGKNRIMSTGVTTSGTPGSSGAHTTITISDDTPTPLFYQCTAHGQMGGRVNIMGGKRARLNITTDKSNAGDGTTVGFTILADRTVDDVLVFVDGICLVPTDDYTISGTTLTFVAAPVASAEIVIRYLG